MADRMVDYGGGDKLHQLLADIRRQRESEAASRGMTLDELEALEEAERKKAEDAARRREEAEYRARWIASWTEYLPAKSCGEIFDGSEKPTDALRHVKGWLGTETPCLILCGGVGTGKTYAAVWAAKERNGEFVPAPHLARRIDPWKHEAESFRVLKLSRPFIALDDLGAEQDDTRFQQALFALVNSRDSASLRTLITTNLTIPQIRPRYGDRIADRLNAMAKAIQLKGTSLRKQGAGL